MILGRELRGSADDGCIDHYHIRLYLNGGAFGDVYKATCGDRLAALKITHRTFNDLDDLRKMLNEASVLNRLKSLAPHAANLLEVYQFGVLENYYNRGFIAMEFASKGTLRDRLSKQGERQPLPIAEAVDVLRQVSAALQVAHAQMPAILHRDIKPSNILIMYEGTIKLGDFGLAAATGQYSLATRMAGDLRYKSPEALKEDVELCSSDIYSLGIVAYEMVTGFYPFPITGLRDLVGSQAIIAHGFARRSPITPPARLNSKISAGLEHVILKALAYELADRYQSVDQLLADLNACV